MSAHNRRAEHLHRTILRKARTMQLTCNTPGFLWDEFCATAAYLTTLTATTANLGKTPFKLWFGCKPSLSNLCEIGCHAFVLQLPAPSKIYAHSKPYTLIGYSPHSKAYHLWDPISSRVITSFHVTLTKHLDSQPSSLHPGTVLGTNGTTQPPSWDTPGPNPAMNTCPPSSNPLPYPPDYLDSLSPHLQQNDTSNTTSRNTINLSRNTITTSRNNVETPRNTIETSRSTTVDSSMNNVPATRNNATKSNTTIENNDNKNQNTITTSSNTVTNNDAAANNNNTAQASNETHHPLTVTIPPALPFVTLHTLQPSMKPIMPS
jgi:hypothetical protein